MQPLNNSSQLQHRYARGKQIIKKYLSKYSSELPKDVYDGFRSFIFPTIKTHGGDYPHSQVSLNGVTINYVKVAPKQTRQDYTRPIGSSTKRETPILAFIHGLANNWEGWIPVIEYLRDDYTLYFLDLPGFGDSDSLPKYSVRIAADYIAKFVGQLPEKPTAVVGASMGTLVTGALIDKYPNVADSIVLIGPVIKDGNTNVLARTLKYSMWAIQHFDFSEKALKKILEMRIAAYTIAKTVNMHKFDRFIIDTYNLIGKKKMRKEAFTQMTISSAEYDLKSVIEKLRLPTLLLYGREDKISSPNYARETLLPLNKNLTVVDIPEAGHVAPMEKPRETARAIRRFLT